jgi:hypothetical protein
LGAPPPKPIADLQPARIDLTKAEPRHTIDLRNAGDGALNVTGVTTGGKNPEDFQVDPRECANASLARGGSCTMSVTYLADPAKKRGHRTSETVVNVFNNADGSPQAVTVTGSQSTRDHKKVFLRILEIGAIAGGTAAIYEATHTHSDTPAPNPPQPPANPNQKPTATQPPPAENIRKVTPQPPPPR